MRKIRVLIVDDAVVVRKIVSDTLSSDPDIEVAGVAANGKIGLAKIPQINPDVITLDIEMPEMDGLQTLAEIRKVYATLPVIMFSTLTEKGGAKTLEALALGATDYVTKPANVGSVSIAMQRIREELIPKIKSFCAEKAGLQPPPTAKPLPLPPNAPPPQPYVPKIGFPKGRQKIEVVAIGVSTGGPNALAELFPVFPADFPVPILITQHMPPFFTRLLAERLSSKSNLNIIEGTPNQVLKPGHAWVAPGDYHMVIERKGSDIVIVNNQNPPENSCRPAVDVMFRSIASIYGAHTLAVVLTGMGQDGLIGCEHIKGVGGQVVVQDESTSVVWGMPGFVTRAGLADKVLPLKEIGPEIINLVKMGREIPLRR
ncbi:MAG: chemotaxis response regulator protein-glutamate methylesterase [Nitrospinae bacterium CG11_big_fil_rev_8_21_14_0_20_56_8]|nr:MAG: chemotaxis response regulator protein-glutamate methylesterase [Nitrospinae bacterium CG11_big_fil_rev_8_21_14_0_20_56_8]